MPRPRILPLTLLASLAILLVVAGVAMWRMSRIGSPSAAQATAEGVPPPPEPPPADVVAGPPALQQAFLLAFPQPTRRVSIGGEEATARFSPRQLYQLGPSTWVLLSEAQNMDEDSHAAAGFFAVTYFTTAPQLAATGRTFVGVGSLGGWGHPPELQVVTGLAAEPMVLVTSSFSGQGSTETTASLVRRGPTAADVRSVASAIPMAYDDRGNNGSCEIIGRLVAGSQGAIRVRYSGSYVGELVYRKTAYGYNAPEVDDLYTRCPEGRAEVEEEPAR